MKAIFNHARWMGVFFVLAWGCFHPVLGQFSTDKISIRIGYQGHYAPATRFNHLVTEFNRDRYPFEIKENLGSLNFLRGIEFGGNYHFREDMFFYGILKNKHQFLEAGYMDTVLYRQYFFRENTAEFGMAMAFHLEGRITHWAQAGVIIGYMSAFTHESAESGKPKTKDMLAIDHPAVLGLNLAYEAQFKVHEQVRLFVRPHLELSLPSNVSKLNAFFNPVYDASGVSYVEKADPKWNGGTLNGLGIEAGLLISLPKIDF